MTSVAPFSVRSGSTYADSGGNIYSVTKIILRHASNNGNTTDNDVAVVQVSIYLNVSI